MKKFVAYLGISIFAMIALESCSKKGNYTCACDIIENGGTSHWTKPYTDVKKSDAKKDCQDIEDRFNAKVPSSADCTLN